MELNRIANAPRLVLLAGEPFFVGRPTPRGLGYLLEEAKAADPEAQLYDDVFWGTLDRANGRIIALWAVLYRHNPGFGLPKALELAAVLDDAAYGSVLDIYFNRPGEDRKGKKESRGHALSWGERLDRVRRALEHKDYEALLDCSFDQIEALLNEGIAGADVVDPAEIAKLAAKAKEERLKAEAEGRPWEVSPEAKMQIQANEMYQRWLRSEESRKAALRAETPEGRTELAEEMAVARFEAREMDRLLARLAELEAALASTNGVTA